MRDEIIQLIELLAKKQSTLNALQRLDIEKMTITEIAEFVHTQIYFKSDWK